MKTARFLVIAMVAALLLAACGTKGPLVVPKDDPAASKPQNRKP